MTILPSIDPKEVVLLFNGSCYSRKCLPGIWYGFSIAQSFNYARNYSIRYRGIFSSPVSVSMWIENEVGNDTLLAYFIDGKEMVFL